MQDSAVAELRKEGYLIEVYDLMRIGPEKANELGVAGFTRLPAYQYRQEPKGEVVTTSCGTRHKGQIRKLFSHRKIEE